MTVTVELLRERLELIEERFDAYVKEAGLNGGYLKRHEIWRHDYLSFPYLLGAPDERVSERYYDVFINTTDLDNKGRFVPLPADTDDSFIQKFTHLLEEYGARTGGLPVDIIKQARKPVVSYFENGEPIGVRMFSGYTPPTSAFVVKYGRREFLEPMLHTGRLRVSPASYYNDGVHNAAVKDDEMRRTFYIPTFRERLQGVYHLNFQGRRIEFGDDDIAIPVIAPNYFLFSLCDHIYYRLPTDFGADAALIVHNPDLFAQRLISSFLVRWSDWEPLYGPVIYYDPYRDYTKMRVHQMSKHFGYAYQREIRIALKPKHQIRAALQPEFLEIGSMNDYADLVYA